MSRHCLVLMLFIWLVKMYVSKAAYSSTGNLIHKSIVGCSSYDGSPVCASNGLIFFMFPNECMMKETNNEKYLGTTSFKQVALELCKNNCDVMCASVYEPVCCLDPATNTKRTFYNGCEMKRDACLNKIDWRPHKNGKCIESEIPKTTTTRTVSRRVTEKPTNIRKSIPCLDEIYNPVCGIFSGVKSTFGNECLVNAENVKTGNKWKVFTTGVCPEDYRNNLSNKVIRETKVPTHSNVRKSYPAPRSNNIETGLGDDVNFIYAPAIFETQFIDENGAPISTHQNYESDFQNKLNRQNTPKNTESQDFQNYRNLQNYQNIQKYKNLLNYPKISETQKTFNNTTVGNKTYPAKPISFVSDNIEKVTECIFGSVEICGILEEENKKRTFGNICELMLRNIFLNQTWVVLHDGKCNNSDCTHNCHKYRYDPVCVSKNGVNYTMANDCYVNYNICKNKRIAWKIISKGECGRPFIQDKYESSTLGFTHTSSYNEETTTITPRTTSINTTTSASTTIPTISTISTTSTTKSPIAFRTSTPAFSLSETKPTITAKKLQFKSKIPVTKTPSLLLSKISITSTSIIPTPITATTSATTHKNTKIPSLKLSYRSLTTLSPTSTTATTPTYTTPSEFSTTSNSNTVRFSIYGPQPNSVIMQLVKNKAKTYKYSAYAYEYSKST